VGGREGGREAGREGGRQGVGGLVVGLACSLLERTVLVARSEIRNAAP